MVSSFVSNSCSIYSIEYITSLFLLNVAFLPPHNTGSPHALSACWQHGVSQPGCITLHYTALQQTVSQSFRLLDQTASPKFIFRFKRPGHLCAGHFRENKVWCSEVIDVDQGHTMDIKINSYAPHVVRMWLRYTDL